MWQKLGYPKLRNATVSTIAPTGTISLIAGASSGIEPLFAGVTARNVLDGERLVDIHPAVEILLKQRGNSLQQITEDVISRELQGVWSPSHRVDPIDHVRTQAAFQRHCDSAVSKTINLPGSASVEAIEQAYRLAYASGCKGITVYRDKSKATQVLEVAGTQDSYEVGAFCPSC
jgi:ribonucleoside-diphosphate reductase alpha chain